MKKVDIIFGAILGELVAWYFILAFKELGSLIAKFGLTPDSVYFILPISFPILAVAALWIAYILGKKFLIILQFSKFFLTGTAITLVDLGVLNFLIWFSEEYTDIIFSAAIVSLSVGIAIYWSSVFKFISAVISLTVKFLPAKLWVFEKSEKEKQKKEFSGFIAVGIIGLLINVAAFTLIVGINPIFGFSKESWANVGAIGAAFIGLGWNFLGSKFFVFKK